VSIVTVIDRATKRVVTGPDIHARGIAEDDSVFDEIVPKITAAPGGAPPGGREGGTGVAPASICARRNWPAVRAAQAARSCPASGAAWALRCLHHARVLELGQGL